MNVPPFMTLEGSPILLTIDHTSVRLVIMLYVRNKFGFLP